MPVPFLLNLSKKSSKSIHLLVPSKNPSQWLNILETNLEHTGESASAKTILILAYFHKAPVEMLDRNDNLLNFIHMKASLEFISKMSQH